MHIRSDGQAVFTHPQPAVFQAAEQAIANIPHMKVTEADGTSGRITASAGASAWSWGETITLAIEAEGATTTVVHVTAAPKLFTDLTSGAKDREDVQAILEAMAQILDRA